MRSTRPECKHRRVQAEWQRAPAARARHGAGKGHDSPRLRGISFPPFQPSKLEPSVTVTGLASQKLRRTMWQLTGGQTGTDEELRGLSTTDLSSALDMFLDTCTIKTDGGALSVARARGSGSPVMFPERATTHTGDPMSRHGELVVGETPWYYPPLKAALLRQQCCYPDDNVIFCRPTLKQFSTLSNCSDATILHSLRTFDDEENAGKDANAGAAAHAKKKLPTSRVELNKKKNGSFPKNSRGSGISLNANAHTAIALDDAEQLRRRRMRERRFLNYIHQWCDKVMLLSGSVKAAHDPVGQHEQCMMVIRKEEEVLLLEMQLERHQAMQERECCRQRRQREARENGSLRSTLKDISRPNNWRRLLSTWSVVTEEAHDGHDEETETVNGKVEARRLIASPRLLTMRETDAVPMPGGAPACRSHSHDACRSPLEDLRRLLDVIARHSVGTLAQAISSPLSPTKSSSHTPIPSREGMLFPPQGSVYTQINWVERIIHADDLPGIRQLTQRLGECVGAAKTPACASFPTSEVASASGVGCLGNATAPSHAPFLLPLQLVYNVHGALERVVLADAVSLIPPRCSTRRRGGNPSPTCYGKSIPSCL
ncbi:hypothetical protein TraAM80_02776 [Trypanosoma rangeli]|uniref:Uncharacterized protein n=1 Tax=Trypanosoma rangeli TaxID=5698 RepID=A0A422NSX7_TRYRA|nr:uncharacterized protein TraAM80_02776 [Trypanosoma rangeli]RNF08539.1 hypothetical protein TraAM80_02776 [Trypanosoma rangeli]|eukprot:RNF08539.1 hypothetical protein TraAM80_02776 [Trypanosoma rangeli]